MHILKWIILCIALLIPLAAQAQPGQDWRVVVYEPGGGTPGIGGILDVLGPSGVVARYALPASIYPSDPNAYTQIVVSPDRRYAAIAFNSNNNQPAPPVSIIDLTMNACCVSVTTPLPNVQGYSLAGFNPQSTQLAFSYVAYSDPNAFSPDGGLVVADAATGNVVSSYGLAQMAAAVGGQSYFAFAYTGGWTPQGIRFTPSCWACEGVMEAPWYTWDPANNLVGTVNNAYFSIFADTLPGTGELLYTVDNPHYPSVPADGMFAPANVVEYFQNGVPMIQDGGGLQSNAPNAPIVYFDQNNLSMKLARWVANGAAFVVQGTQTAPTAVVVFRNQARTTVAFGPTDTFLAGTSDGWLAQDAANNINRYTVSPGGGAVNVTSVGQFAPNSRAVWSTPLGVPGQPPFTLIAGAPFTPTVAPPPQLATPTFPPPVQAGCANAPPPRLSVGGQGRVTPGTPNNIRSAPSLTAAIAGQIPAGGVFAVVSGPTCSSAPDGIVWWGINYNGRLGYTAEGRYNEYWVEPMAAG